MFKLLKDGMSLEPADPIENLLPPSAEDNDLRNLSSRSTRFYPWACLKISEPIGCIVDRRFILMALSAFDLSINSSIQFKSSLSLSCCQRFSLRRKLSFFEMPWSIFSISRRLVDFLYKGCVLELLVSAPLIISAALSNESGFLVSSALFLLTQAPLCSGEAWKKSLSVLKTLLPSSSYGGMLSCGPNLSLSFMSESTSLILLDI